MGTRVSNGGILVAGASGAVGRPLCRLLIQDGWRVFGTTRSAEKAEGLRALGVEPVIVDVFDGQRLHAILAAIRPGVVIHQLTDLPPGLDPARMADALERNSHLREAGTRNLVAGAAAAGVRRMVAQSIAFAYAPGPQPYDEQAPLNTDAPDRAGRSARGVASLERQVLEAPLDGLILRYGRFYGPGTGFDQPPAGAPLHVDAAADAARRAATTGSPGIYNIAEEDGSVSTRRAAAELGWQHHFRIDPPKHGRQG